MALKDFVGKVGARPEPTPEPEGRTPGSTPPARRPEPPAPPPRAERASAPAALLDASVEFKGTIECHESIRIDGRCEGELRSDHAVVIGEPARLRMSIEADSVIVAGDVQGDITARRKITLEPTARVRGNLITPGIVIQEGAKLEGRILIGDDKAPEASARPAVAEKPEPKAAPAESKPEAPRKPTPNAPPPSS